MRRGSLFLVLSAACGVPPAEPAVKVPLVAISVEDARDPLPLPVPTAEDPAPFAALTQPLVPAPSAGPEVVPPLPAALPRVGLHELLPIIDPAGTFVIVPFDFSGGALVKVHDDTVVPFADDAAITVFVGKGRTWQGLVRMEGTPVEETEDNPYLLNYVFRDRGLRVRFREPDLVVDLEATNTVVTKRHATWWQSPQPAVWPGQEHLPPEERAGCPRPFTSVAQAWVSTDHRVLALLVDHMQPTCVCGDAEGDRWHILELPPT